LKKNFGPALARNIGVKKSKGDIISFLDNDTTVEKNWIKEAVEVFKDSKIGIVQCKLLLANEKNKFDYTGETFGSLGFLVQKCKYKEIDNGQYDLRYNILSAKSAGMFIRKSAFNKAGGFDPKYFIFMEETDLGWRTWLAGYQAVFAHKSIVYHKFSSTKKIVDKHKYNNLVRFHGTKNYIYTLIKNLSNKNLIKILPIHIFLWVSLSAYLFLTGKFTSALNIQKGIFWNLINIKNILNQRKKIQHKRLFKDDSFMAENNIFTKISLNHYINNFLNSQKEVTTPENQ